MATFAEMKKDTAIKVKGIVNSVNTYVSKNGNSYYSVDLLIDGHKNMVNVRISPDVDRSKIVEGDFYIARVIVSEFNGRTSLDVV